jgi:hypothetical protein
MAPKGSVKAARRIDIKGQGHMLAYITPKEAELLKAHGGSGKPGPKGIPSFEDDGPDTPTFYNVPLSTNVAEPEYKRVYIGSSQDTVQNRMAGSSDLASRTQDAGPGYLPKAVNRDAYEKQYARDLAKLRGQPDPYPDKVEQKEAPVTEDVGDVSEGGTATDDAKNLSKMGKESTISTTSQGLLKKAKTRKRSLMTGLIS